MEFCEIRIMSTIQHPNVSRSCLFFPSISDPEERPDFSTLVDDFESKLVQETDYIDLNMFPEHAYYNDVSLSGEKV